MDGGQRPSNSYGKEKGHQHEAILELSSELEHDSCPLRDGGVRSLFDRDTRVLEVMELPTPDEPGDKVDAEILKICRVSKLFRHVKVCRLPSPLGFVLCPAGKPPPFAHSKRDDSSGVLVREGLDL